MVQVGSWMDQEHQDQGPQQDQPWTRLINDAVKQFVQTVGDSSRQLAEAAERFAGESLSLIDTAASKAESSASISSQMADAAKTAAADAQKAAEAMQNAVAQATEQVRNETRSSVDEALAQAREAQQMSERARAEMRQEAEALIQRIERSSEGSQEVIRAAQEATSEVKQAAEHISETSRNVDTSVAAAEEAAAQARGAAERIEGQASATQAVASNMQQVLQEARGISARIASGAGGVDNAVQSAQRAADAANAAAQQVEERINQATAAVEAGQRAAQQAQQAADRLESTAGAFESTVSDVRAVAEQTRREVAQIHETAASATSAANSAHEAWQSAAAAAQRAEQAGSAPAIGPQADTLLDRLEADYQRLTALVGELASRVSSIADVAWSQIEPTEELVYEAPAGETDETPPIEAYEASAEPVIERLSVSETPPEVEVEAGPTSVQPVGIQSGWIEKTISYPSSAAGELSAQSQLAAVTQTPYGAQSTETSNETAAGAPLFGRIEVNIAPVPDFDRLLTLDGALSRIEEVQAVTLADYDQEKAMFRIDVSSPMEAEEFARQLGEAAGLATEVTRSDSKAVTIRLT